MRLRLIIGVARRHWLVRAVALCLLLVVACKVAWLISMEPRRVALARLRECGCAMTDAYYETPDPDWDATFAQLNAWGFPRSGRYLFPVDGFSCNSTITDDLLRDIGRFSEITELWLDDSTIADDQMRHLSKLRNLSVLYLTFTSISDEGVAHLQNLNRLRILDLSDTQIRGESFKHLSCRESLEELNLQETMHLTDEGVRQLRLFRNLKRLNLLTTRGDGNLRGDSFAVLAELRELQVLMPPDDQYREYWEPHVQHVPDVGSW